MTGRSDVRPMAIMVAVAMLFAGAVYGWVAGLVPVGSPVGAPVAPPSASASPTSRAPQVKIVHETCCEQTARFLNASWESSERVAFAGVRLEPAPPFDCGATVDASGLKGTFGCAGFLPGAKDQVAHLTLVTAGGTFPMEHKFRTMGDRLENVKWFTEFEDPTGDPLACAAASIRIIHVFTTGEDKMTATGILALGRPLNRSRDPGIDPVAIATVLDRLEPRNDYHYYRFATREEATAAAVYWLFRSGKPVMAITLAGQHGPVVIGFEGTYGTYYDDPTNKVTAVVVEDPQRGDMRPETASRRPDKYRTPEFQTGRPLLMDEWLKDEWWLGFAYQATIRMPDGTTVNIERNDGAYPTPHWGGTFVLLVDDADSEWPADKEGRVKFR